MFRSALLACVVGTLLTAVNQGDRLLSGPLTAGLLARVLCNYLVPFAVATVSAALNGREAPREARNVPPPSHTDL